MKVAKIVISVVLLVYFVSLYGCGFAVYRKQTWETRTGIKKMQVTKLQHQPTIGDSVNGYYGIIANHCRHSIVTATFSGPENFAITLPASTREITMEGRYLLPGEYTVCFISDRGKTLGTGTFHSNQQMDKYRGIDVHWFAWCND